MEKKIYIMSWCKHEIEEKPKQDKSTTVNLWKCSKCGNWNFHYKSKRVVKVI